MQKRISTIPFTDTPEQHQKLLDVIERLKGQKGAVMPALQEAQDIYGYLPIEVQKEIARGLDVSLEEVYGVSTFYSQFSLTPKGKYHISICLGTACYVKGADKVLDRILSEGNFGRYYEGRNSPRPEAYTAGKLHSFRITTGRYLQLFPLFPGIALRYYGHFIASGVYHYFKGLK